MRFNSIIIFFCFMIVSSCDNNSNKEKYISILKDKIGNQLPFNDIKIANIDGGTAVILDNFYCYWIDDLGKIYCVNGTSKSVLHNKITGELECEDAPIKETFSDINKIAK